MLNRILVVLLLFFAINAAAQERDFSWWNELHDWQIGDPGWRQMIIMSSGYTGPNALPVPEIKRGFLTPKSEFEITASNHFHKQDPTQDISGRIYLPFAKNKIAIEAYGVIFEKFAFSEQIRNERFSRIEDGKGTAIGDFYFSTLIQIAKDRKFPNTLFRFATKTASGNMLEGARYTDTPGYFFDVSFSRDYGQKKSLLFRPIVLLGFYSWQTFDELNPQNDALMYALGFDVIKNTWLFSGSWSGYSGYKNHRDRPMQLNAEIRKDWEKSALRFQYIHGLRAWSYKTVRLSYIWKFGGIN